MIDDIDRWYSFDRQYSLLWRWNCKHLEIFISKVILVF